MNEINTAVDVTGMQWNDTFLLGHGPIDAVHEEFVELLARLQGAGDADLVVLMNALVVHLTHHFEMENNAMLETAFPPRDCHMDEHAAVMRSVLEVQQQLAAGDTAVCRALVDELARWFPSHADYLDSALAHWLTQRALGGKPVVVRRGLQLR